jgi:hypothetical protein
MNITNHTALPEPVFQALTRSDYTKGGSNRSVTQLIDSPRVRILRKENDERISEDVADMLWSVLGTAVHKMFEDNEVEGHISEERLYAEVENWIISGAIDVQRGEADGKVTVLDYKCTSAWSVIYGKPEWDKQLNFYAWLVEHCKEIEVGKLQIVAVLRDWQRKKAEVDSHYPQAPRFIKMRSSRDLPAKTFLSALARNDGKKRTLLLLRSLATKGRSGFSTAWSRLRST